MRPVIEDDFFAHASYRVTGNAVAMGEAAGVAAALSAQQKQLPQELSWIDVSNQLAAVRQQADEYAAVERQKQSTPAS